MMHACLQRLPDNDDKQTLGEFSLYDDDNRVIFQCKTLELEWRNNAVRKSCIPAGHYICVPRWSRKYKRHFHVQDVNGRTYILIHPGNYHWHTLGCILVGQSHLDINHDGLPDVTSSKPTMRMLNQVTKRKQFRLEIKD